MPTPLHISSAHALSALLQSVHCDPNPPIRLPSSHANRSRPILGLRSVALRPRVNMLSTAVIRLYAHEVADLSRCRILAQTAIEMDRTREQSLLSFWDDDEAQMQRGTERKFERVLQLYDFLKQLPLALTAHASKKRETDRVDVPLQPRTPSA
ncbi:hypothetical protein BU25DRAFT_273945 [Macroventuria anomochaeta]|uniref:Uncharacterized protein n=1 Tax=Macroventuria anomochaeta TaxID=301207 RepID=A0ACB6S9I4_9PLEO|nr:uncharacterized protein BU25DRAFT_273945 [Macroventuria anomochaeta]KAF2629767.1 hypothetical protein BU25DRAFT_273945 [Macroventuria anomochaeta]